MDNKDSYSLWVPIEDTDLMKSVTVDENGDFIVQGVMTSDDKDEEDDSITPDGMDCSYFLTKGWIKYEHGTSPDQFIGEPLEVKVGRFEHPKTQKSVNGIFVKGRLFAHRELTRKAVQTIEDLQKSNTKRTMGWSIEGNVKERDRKSGKIMKSILRNVVLTMNPINTTTWAELAKSFAKNHEVEVNMEDVEKSMDIDTAASIMPQSIEGYNPKKDPQQNWVDLFRKFVKENGLQKSTRNEFITNASEEYAGYKGYAFAKREGLDYEEAFEFASYIAEKQEFLKSLFGRIGGETMSDKKKSTLAAFLDADLEELQKSLETDELDEQEESLEKSANAADDEDEDEKDKKSDGEDDSEDDSEDESDDNDDDSEEESDDDDDSEKDDESDDDDTEKSFTSDLRKSLTDEHGQAFEVSGWLGAITDELGFSMEGLQKSMTHMTKQQSAIVKAMATFGSTMQAMADKLEAVEARNVELEKSLGAVLERPVGRKSVVNQREATTLTKSVDAQAPSEPLTRAKISDILVKSFQEGQLDGKEVIRFDAGVGLRDLNLPKEVKTKLGLQ
jgi:hypothetical protein